MGGGGPGTGSSHRSFVEDNGGGGGGDGGDVAGAGGRGGEEGMPLPVT